jgi:hypothetical protein
MSPGSSSELVHFLYFKTCLIWSLHPQAVARVLSPARPLSPADCTSVVPCRLPPPIRKSVKNQKAAFTFFFPEQLQPPPPSTSVAAALMPPANPFARASVPLGLLSFSPSATDTDPSPSDPLTRKLKTAIDGVLYSSGHPSGDLHGPYKLCPELHHSPRTHFLPRILLSEPQASPHHVSPATATSHHRPANPGDPAPSRCLKQVPHEALLLLGPCGEAR